MCADDISLIQNSGTHWVGAVVLGKTLNLTFVAT